MRNDWYLNRLRKWLTVSLVFSFIPLWGMLLSLPIAFIGLLTLTNHPNDYVQRTQRFLLGGMGLIGIVALRMATMLFPPVEGALLDQYKPAFIGGLAFGMILNFLGFANLLNIPEIKQAKRTYVEYILYAFLIIFTLVICTVVMQTSQPVSTVNAGGGAIGIGVMVTYIAILINARRICKIEPVAPVAGKSSSVMDLLFSHQCVGMVCGLLVSIIFCLLIK